MGLTQVEGITATDNIQGGAITASTIDSTPIGGTVPAAGSFTTVSAATGVFTGDVRVSGKVTIGQAVSAVSLHADTTVSAGTNIFANGDISTLTGSVIASAFVTATSGALVLTSVASGQGAQLATTANGPVAGNPSFWVPIRINGVIRFFPCW